MKLLACIDGSQWSVEALRYLERWRHSTDTIHLLYVALRGGEGYLECGRMALEAAMHHCGLRVGDPHLRCRLEVGDPASRILAVCREERPDVLAMGSLGANGFPYLTSLGPVAQTVGTGCQCPIVLASPCGIELLAGEERILTTPRTSPLPPRRHAGRSRPACPTFSAERPVGVPPELTQLTAA